MLRKTLTYTKRLCLIVLHMLAGLFLLGLVVVVIGIWKLSQGPADITFAADYIKDSFRAEGYPVDITFDAVVISWEEFKGTPSIDLSDFTILEKGREKMHVGQVGLKVAVLPLLIGQIKPEAVTLNNPVIRIVREENGSFRMLLQENKEDAESQTEEREVAPASFKEIGEGLFLDGYLPDPNLRLLSSLKMVSIKNAKLVTKDKVLGRTWAVPNISVFLNRTDDLVELSVGYQSPGQIDSTALEARILRGKDDLEYSLDIRNVDLTLFTNNIIMSLQTVTDKPMLVSGVVDGKLNQNWSVISADMALRSPEGEVRLGEDDRDLLAYKNLMVNLAYDRDAPRLSIRDTQVDLNGTTLSISGERAVDTNGRAVFPLKVAVPELKLSQIEALWPENQRDTLAAQWLVRDLTLATLKNIQVTANIPIEDPQSMSGNDVEASFDFENLHADYRAPLTPGSEAKGRALIKNDTLDITIDSGRVGDLEVTAGRITIEHLTAMDKIGDAVIDLTMHGPLKSAFEYISLEPISLGEELGIDVKGVQGRGDFHVLVSFPAIADLLAEQVKVKVDATLRDALLPKMVQGLNLSGGPFALKVDGGAFSLSGKGLLDKTPIDMTYSEYLNPVDAPYASEIKASLVTDEALRDVFGINLEDFISGNVPVDIVYKEAKPGEVTVDVKADLTQAKAFVDPLYYSKKPGQPGSATCVAVLKDDRIQKITDLNIVMGNDKASGGTLNFGKVGPDWDVASGSFSHLSLGADNALSLKFTQPSPNVLDFTVKGDRLDARSFLTPDDPGRAAEGRPDSAVAVRLTAQTKLMRTGDEPDQVLRDADIKADSDAEGRLRNFELSASASGSPFHLTLRPDQAGVMKLKITADNAGKALYALDLYDTMVGGTLAVEGTQVAGGQINDIKGTATVRDFSIVKAPALAQLINGMSLSGFDELLQNKGIAFTKLRTRFVWKETKEGRVINLSDGRTSGASIGLTFGGTINQSKGEMDISGTFVPMSEINRFVSRIPIVGALLTGGRDGGIIAATYAMKGNSDNPRVFINPLSVLTPGFLRSILFEGGLDMDDNEDDSEPSEKAAPKARAGYN